MNYTEILEDLLKRSFESSWFDFKENWFNPDGLGAYLSGIANIARVVDAKFGYIVWGINDKSHMFKILFHSLNEMVL